MPSTPGGFRESLTADEVFPRSLPAETQELQLCQLPQGLLRRKMGARGEVVYMFRGTIVQKSEEALACFVGLHTRRLRRRRSRPRGYVDVPPQLDAEIRRIGHLPGESCAQQPFWTFGEELPGGSADREDGTAFLVRVARGDERA